jgi:hypothetical protein
VENESQEPTQETDPGSVVQGQISRPDETSIAHVTVRAGNVNIVGDEQFLGERRTDRDGRYTISFDRPRSAHDATSAVNVVVHVLDSTGAVVKSSPTMFNAPSEATVNLVVAGAIAGIPSEYERLMRTVRPLVADAKGQSLGAKLAGLTPAGVSFAS